MGPLVKEKVDVKLLIEELLKLGWRRGEEYGVEGLRKELIEWPIFEKVFKEINGLSSFKQSEANEILSYVKEKLKVASAVEVLNYLKDGINVRVGGRPYTFALIDYENLNSNVFLVGHEVEFPGFPQDSRPDFTLYVNGIPLVVIEVKPFTAIGENALSEGLRQLSRYEVESPDLFRFVQLGVVYNGKEASVFRATLPNYAKAEKFIQSSKWKPPDSNQCNILDLLNPDRILNMIRWYTFYKGDQGDKKIVARYMQYRASEHVMKRIDGYLLGKSDKNKGLVWHWQGTGKTFTMFFIAHKFYKRYYDRDPVVFFIVDRKELERQLFDEFIKDLIAPYFNERIKIIESIDELRNLLKSMKESELSKNRIERGVYVVLIQKFRPEDLEGLEPIYKKEVLLLIDEAHRSVYGILGATLNKLFPKAMKFAFTGTPVFRYERNTFQYFSYPQENELYLDRYFISDSISDGYTVPLVYQVVTEKEGVRLLADEKEIKDLISIWLKNSEFLGSIDDYVDEDVSDEVNTQFIVTKQDIRRRINRINVFLENSNRLKTLAEFIASRIEEDTEDFKFKAMVVTASRRACIRFKKYLDEALVKKYGEEARAWSEVVMSYEHNDPHEILEYRDEMLKRWHKIGVSNPDEVNKEIQNMFRERDNPKILIVTDMLISGFDCPRLKVMYLDKPIYEHKLLQAIARVNRPFTINGTIKQFGLIIDSVGLIKHVKETILTYDSLRDEKIIEDISKSLVRDADAEFSEFLITLDDLKSRLKGGMKIGIHEFSIDIDELKTLDEVSLRKRLEEDIEPILKTIALSVHIPESHQVLELMKRVISLFEALGANPKKIDYIREYNLIRWMHEYIWCWIKGRKPPREFWEYLIKRVHERSDIRAFVKLKEELIDEKAVMSSIDEVKKRLSSKLNPHSVASEVFLGLRALLGLELANPLYKHIYERLKKLEEDWLMRGDTSALAKYLKDASELIQYREKVKTLPKEDKIIHDVKQAIMQRFKVEANLTHFIEALKHITFELQESELFEKHLQKLKIGLLKDLAMQLKGVERKEKVSFVDEVISYVRQELGR